MRAVLAGIVSGIWIVLCLALAGWPGPACQRGAPEAAGLRGEPAPVRPLSPTLRADPPVCRLDGLLPPGPEDPHLLRGRPPAGVMS